MKEMKITLRGDVAEVLLYDVIGSDFFGEGITAKQFRDQIKGIKASTINLRINSPGGSVFEAAAMLNTLDDHKARIEVDVDGIAASAASVIAMAGDEVRVASNGMLMIHNAHGMVMGTADDMRQTAELLDKVNSQIADTYARRVEDRKRIKAWMDAETWFTGQEAVDAGFADKVNGPVKVAACFDLSKFGFKHTPKLPEPERVDLSAYRSRIAALAGV